MRIVIWDNYVRINRSIYEPVLPDEFVEWCADNNFNCSDLAYGSIIITKNGQALLSDDDIMLIKLRWL